MLNIILIITIGIIFGTITGLLPGIHVNLIATLLLINLNLLNQQLNNQQLIIFTITMAITHTFIDILPNIYLMIPDSDNSLTLLPTQKLLLQGKSLEAVFISGLGSLTGSIISIVLIPLLYNHINTIYNYLNNYIKTILILVIITFIIQEKGTKKIWATIIVSLSAILGIFALNSYFLTHKLTIIFTGLFGAPALITAYSNNSTIPKQKTQIKTKLNKNYLTITILSSLLSFITALFPGITNSQAISILSLFFKKITSKIFIFGTSIINTLNFILSLIIFLQISKIRNGIINTINTLDITLNTQLLQIYPYLILSTSFISFILLLLLSRLFVQIYNKFQIQKEFFLTLFFLLTYMIIKISGFYGLLYFYACCSLGLFTTLINIRKVNLMSILIIPIIFLI